MLKKLHNSFSTESQSLFRKLPRAWRNATGPITEKEFKKMQKGWRKK